MRYLFFCGSSILMPHTGVLINEALSLDDADEIYWVWCNGKKQACISNMGGNPLICRHCKSRTQRLVNRYLKNKVTFLPLFDESIKYKHKNFAFKNIQELKQMSYNGCNIGYPIASTYISLIRDSLLQFSKTHQDYYSFLTNCSIERIMNLEKIILDKKPDCIVVFNGRFFDTAICVELAKKYKINYLIKEVLDGPRTGKPYVIESYSNHSVFDIKYKNKLIEDSWNKSILSENKKNKIGSEFYYKKKNGINVVDKSYVNGQTLGLLPPNWDTSKRNIVIFNSSEDELASIGSDYDSYSLYNSQLEGIENILKQFRNDSNFCFYLRIHPNLGKLDNVFVRSLLKLQDQYKNVTVIPPLEKISTYSLLDNAEKVITFGSSVGIEASFWGKPSILLSASEYYFSNSCYIPKSESELIKIIKSDLPTKDQTDAIKYAFFLLDRDVRCHKAQYIDLSYRKIKCLNKDIYIFSYDKYLGSELLSRIVSLFNRKIISLFAKNRYLIPDKIMLENI